MESQKKIGIVVDTLNGGGAEKVCIVLARQFVSMNCIVRLIIVKPLCDYQLPDEVQVCYLLDQKNAKLHKKKNQAVAAEKLKEISKDVGGFDLLLSNLDGAHPIVAQADLANTWYVIHNSVREKLKRAFKLGPIKYFRQKSIYKHFNNKNVVVVSRGLESELTLGDDITPAKIVPIYNPIDFASIHSRSHESISVCEGRYIVHAGRFARMKRHDVLFKALRLLPADVRLVLLCEDGNKLRRLIQRMQLSKRIVVAGFQQNPYPIIRRAEALVLSSEAEGFGMVLVEAMMCGTPVVSTNCFHGPGEILGKEFSHFLSPVGDAKALAENIQRAMREKPDMSKAPILDCVRPEVSAKKYLDLIAG